MVEDNLATESAPVSEKPGTEQASPAAREDDATQAARAATQPGSETQQRNGSAGQVESSAPAEWQLPRWAPWAFWLVAIGTLIGPLSSAGLWDPPELKWAGIGRRIAIHAFGAEQFALEGANNAIPSVEELGRGELPYHLVALGFRVFGLHDWAGRLPLALSALFGALAFYELCRRLSGTKLALFAGLALITTPVFFSQARTILGDAVTMACVAGAFSALALACFDERLSVRERSLASVVAVACLVGGFFCRGLWIGVAVPALPVALGWAILRPWQGRFRLVFGGVTMVTALIAVGWGAWALGHATEQDYWMALGTEIDPPRQLPTHDFVLHHIGHAAFPWSGVLPVALGLLLYGASQNTKHTSQADPSSVSRHRRELALRVALVLCAALAVLAHGALAPYVGPMPFSAAFALAGIVGFGLLEWDRKPNGSPSSAMWCAALLILLFADFRHFPEKGMSAFAMAKPSFPSSFEHATQRVFAAATLPALLAAALLAVERMPWVRRLFAAALVRRSSRPDVWLRRSVLLLVGLGLTGLTLSVGYFPALAAQVSPMGAFDAYAELRQSNEPLATTGRGGNAAAYYGSEGQRHFENVDRGFAWLMEAEDQRRWLVIKADDLAKLNSKYRRQRPGKNLPVLDASSSEILLVSNRLREGEQSHNPLEPSLPETRPTPAHPVDVVFGGKLQTIGWDIQDERGDIVEELRAGKRYTLLLHYEVLGNSSKNWKTFVHIDGQSSRVNADHETLDGKYPFRYWSKGDFVTDIHQFELEPDLVEGSYTLYFGFYSGKKRFDVTKGDHKDDRVNGGTIRIR